ncbi:MAG: hypothetical protein FD167_1434 [bacterium]|nr:MAG: hypothetical protein FD167_1434 [bacterium]
MRTQTGLEKFRNLQSKISNAVELLEKVQVENNGVLPREYSEKAHQLKNTLEDLKEQAIRSNI